MSRPSPPLHAEYKAQPQHKVTSQHHPLSSALSPPDLLKLHQIVVSSLLFLLLEHLSASSCLVLPVSSLIFLSVSSLLFFLSTFSLSTSCSLSLLPLSLFSGEERACLVKYCRKGDIGNILLVFASGHWL